MPDSLAFHLGLNDNGGSDIYTRAGKTAFFKGGAGPDDGSGGGRVTGNSSSHEVFGPPRRSPQNELHQVRKANVNSSRTGRITFKLKNSLSAPRTVVLEPWTTEYNLGPGRTFEIVAEGDLSYPVEIELFENQVIVYSLDSEGAMLTVMENGKELEPSD